MILDIDVQLEYRMDQPTDVIMQVQAPDMPDQHVLDETVTMSPVEHLVSVPAEANIGARTLLRTRGNLTFGYHAKFNVDRPAPDIASLGAVPPHRLSGDAVRYLMPSRYCPSDELQSFADAEFGRHAGGARIAAMRDWINNSFQYVPGASTAQTTAIDTFVQRKGVCRDFAHVLIALARASAIPARFASVYAPHVTPQDFHAVAEVYLDGAWHLVDPTGMATADQIVRIGVGLDAAEVSFLSSFGQATLVTQTVQVSVAT